MRHPSFVRLRHFVQHPLTKLVVGLILVGTGTAEVIADLVATDRSWRIGAHHGVLVLGLMQVLQNIPLLVDGMTRWFEATDANHSGTPPTGE